MKNSFVSCCSVHSGHQTKKLVPMRWSHLLYCDSLEQRSATGAHWTCYDEFNHILYDYWWLSAQKTQVGFLLIERCSENRIQDTVVQITNVLHWAHSWVIHSKTFLKLGGGIFHTPPVTITPISSFLFSVCAKIIFRPSRTVWFIFCIFLTISLYECLRACVWVGV